MKSTGAPFARRQLLLALGCQLVLLGLLASRPGADARILSKRHSRDGAKAAPAGATSTTTAEPAAGASRAAGDEEPKLVITLTSDESKEKLKEKGARPVAGTDDQMELPKTVTTSGLPEEVSGTLAIKAPIAEVQNAAKTVEQEIQTKGSADGLTEDALVIIHRALELPAGDFVELDFGRKDELEMLLKAVVVMLEVINKQTGGSGPKTSVAPTTTKKPTLKMSRLGEIELLRLLSVLVDLDRYKVSYKPLLTASQLALLAKHVNMSTKRLIPVLYSTAADMERDTKEIRRIRQKLEKARDDYLTQTKPSSVSQLNSTHIETIVTVYQLVDSFGKTQEPYREYLSYTEREFLKNLIKDHEQVAIRLPMFNTERERMIYVMRLNSVYKTLLKVRGLVPVTTRKPGVYTIGAMLIQNLTKILDLKSLYDPEFGIKKANLTEDEMRVFQKTIKLEVRRIMIYSYTDKNLRDADQKHLQSIATKVYKLQDLYISRPRSKTTKRPDNNEVIRSDDEVVALVKTRKGEFAVRRLTRQNIAQILATRMKPDKVNTIWQQGKIEVATNNSFLIPPGKYNLPQGLRIVGLAV